MAPVGTLWGLASRQPLSKIILTVAALNDLELRLPAWDWTDRPDDFLSKFPYNKIPAFEAEDGFTLTEGAAIARHLSVLGTKINLLGSGAKDIALVDQWVHFAEHEIGVPSHNIMSMVYGFAGPFNREILDKQVERLERALAYVETYLAGCQSGYLVSDSLTLADIFVEGIIHGTCHFALGKEERAKYDVICAHHARVTQNEKVKKFWDMKDFVDVAIREPTKFPVS